MVESVVIQSRKKKSSRGGVSNQMREIDGIENRRVSAKSGASVISNLDQAESWLGVKNNR